MTYYLKHNWAIFTGRNEVVAKVMFLQVSVILLTGGVSGEPPRPRRTPPPNQAHTPPKPRRPPRTKENPPRTEENPPRTKENPPPGTKENPPREEHCSIRSMSGRYASYWNAFLLQIVLWMLHSKLCKYCDSCQGLYSLAFVHRSILHQYDSGHPAMAKSWIRQCLP